MPRSEIIIYWTQADEAFIAEVPELPGCAADGETCEEALAGIEIIIQEWIETAKELHRPIPASQGRLRLSVSAERFRAPAKEKSKVKNPMVRFRSPHAA